MLPSLHVFTRRLSHASRASRTSRRLGFESWMTVSFSNHEPPSGSNTASTSSTTIRHDQERESTSSVLSDEWVPPNRPLSGDQGYSPPPIDRTAQDAVDDALLFVIDDNDSEEDIQRKLDEVLRLEEELEQATIERELQQEEQAAAQQESPCEPPVDWLATRRAALGARQETSVQAIPIRHHELLTEQELLSLLEYHQAEDIVVIMDNPNAPRMGGARGMIVCEASGGGFHLQSITRALVDHLKERRLQDLGVLGAQMGSNRSMYQQSTWNVVDCQNFIVHILNGSTRRALRLEDLWSGRDPLWRLDVSNEDHVDEYVAANPVPSEYYYTGSSDSTQLSRGRRWAATSSSTSSIGKLERSPFIPHTSVIPISKKHDDRRAGRRKRRELNQGNYK